MKTRKLYVGKQSISFKAAISAFLIVFAIGAANAQIYISQTVASGHGSVLAYDVNGLNPTTLVPGGVSGTLSANVYGLTTDTSGNVYIADYSGQSVREYTTGGTQIGSPYIYGGASNSPFAMAINGSNTYVAYFNTGGVYKYPSSGGNTPALPAVATLGVNSSDALAFDPTGAYLYILSYGNGVTNASKVVKYDIANGTSSDLIINLTQTTGLAVDPSGNIYISSIATDVVTRYNSSGGGATTFVPSLHDPYGLAVANGYLYVANSGDKSVGRYLLSNGTGSSSFISGLAQPDYGITVYINPIPEPSCVALLGMGGIAFASWRTRRLFARR